MTAKSDPKERLAKIITDYQIKLSGKRGHMVSVFELAKHFNVSHVSLARWQAAAGMPEGDNVHKLASRMGPEIYDLVGMPRLMPNDPLARYVFEHWYDLDDPTREKIVNIVEQARANDDPVIEGETT